MNVLDWLQYEAAPGIKVVTRFAELIAVNYGKMIINQLGKVESGGPYGRLGLTLAEGLELTLYVGTLNGLLMAMDENRVLQQAVHMKLQEEMEKHVQVGIVTGSEQELSKAIKEHTTIIGKVIQ